MAGLRESPGLHDGMWRRLKTLAREDLARFSRDLDCMGNCCVLAPPLSLRNDKVTNIGAANRAKTSTLTARKKMRIKVAVIAVLFFLAAAGATPPSVNMTDTETDVQIMIAWYKALDDYE